MKSIALIGFMGSGKSTAGAILAERLGYDFADLDKVATELAGRGVAEVFAGEGEDEWRRLETDALRGLADRERLVLACGGGIIKSLAAREFLKEHFIVVYLAAELTTLSRRLKDEGGRPLLDVADPQAEIERLYCERKQLYEAAANITISTDTLSAAQTATATAAALEAT